MAANNEMMVAVIPAFIVFGMLAWVAIFLETYRHFPHMHKQERIKMSIVNATSMSLILMAVVAVFTYLILVRIS